MSGAPRIQAGWGGPLLRPQAPDIGQHVAQGAEARMCRAASASRVMPLGRGLLACLGACRATAFLPPVCPLPCPCLLLPVGVDPFARSC